MTVPDGAEVFKRYWAQLDAEETQAQFERTKHRNPIRRLRAWWHRRTAK